MIIITEKARNLRQLGKQFRNEQGTIQWERIYKEIGIPIDLLKKPYTYIWIKNIKSSMQVIYVGATKGNINRRGVAIINHILGGSHSHHIGNCQHPSSNFSDEDTITIILIPTEDEDKAFLLEKALLVCLEEKPTCNKS